MVYDTIVIGKGPAGITTAIYLKRANLNCVVIGKDGGALEKTKKIENYYGFENPISGQNLIVQGINQAKKLGIEVITDEVIDICWEENFKVKTNHQQLQAKTLVLATGTNRAKPNIKGIKEFEGKGISYCAVCDAFFYRGKDVSVLGNGSYALHELEHLKPIAKSVTLLTNGEKLKEKVDARVIEKPICEFRGENVITDVQFGDNTSIQTTGIFIAQGMASTSALAKKIGALEKNGSILVDEEGRTNIPGLYAAGDCTGPIYQIAKAIYEGMKVALAIIKQLKANK